MRRVGLILLVAVAIIIQVSLLPALRPFGVVPSLLLPVVVLIGLEGTASVALVAGVVGGVALDLASSANFGMWTAILVLAALTAGLLRRAGFELVGVMVPAVLVAAGTFLETVVILMGVAGSVSSWPIGLVAAKFFWELVINLILTAVMQPVIRHLVSGTEPAAGQVG